MLFFFKKYKNVQAVFSEKNDGFMKDPSSLEVIQNRENFFKKAKIPKEKVFFADQVHSANVQIVNSNSPNLMSNTDALVTKEKNIYLGITTADCIPVYFFDPKNEIVGLAHAGWKGITGGIIENTAEEIIKNGGKAETLGVVLGPGIGKCHFEIKEDILDKFEKFENFILKREDKTFVDLKGIIKSRLVGLGVREEKIETCNVCTYCDQRFFSYRRDKPEDIEAMLAVIGMRE